MGTTASCPRCGVELPRGTARCESCGFVLLEQSAARPLRRPSPLWVAAGAAALAALVAIVVLVTRDPGPRPAEPVARTTAERRLERRLRAIGVEDVGFVRCQGAVRPGAQTRCQLVYRDGDTQLMLVTLIAGGRLDIEVPYPARRRPAG